MQELPMCSLISFTVKVSPFILKIVEFAELRRSVFLFT